MAVAPLRLAADGYARHALHAPDRVWVEKNCYIDVWIELVHALGCDPLAMLPVLVGLDFEGDQWTFYKPVHDELRALYGLDVTELNCWRPLLEHAAEHLGAGKLISTETDAWWLPDTSGTDYRTQHTKSTIIIAALDVAARRLGYFHNAGYFELTGEDFERTFAPRELPLYAELVRIDRLERRPHAELIDLSRALLGKHLARRPVANPVRAFAARFERELPGLQDRGLAHYHAWAFATVRQLGSASELMALYLRWLGGHEPAAAAYLGIAAGAKAFILKGARAVHGKKPLDAAPLFAAWADAWDAALQDLVG